MHGKRQRKAFRHVLFMEPNIAGTAERQMEAYWIEKNKDAYWPLKSTDRSYRKRRGRSELDGMKPPNVRVFIRERK